MKATPSSNPELQTQLQTQSTVETGARVGNDSDYANGASSAVTQQPQPQSSTGTGGGPQPHMRQQSSIEQYVQPENMMRIQASVELVAGAGSGKVTEVITQKQKSASIRDRESDNDDDDGNTEDDVIELSMNDFIEDKGICYRFITPGVALAFLGFSIYELIIYDYNYYDATSMGAASALLLIWLIERSGWFKPKWPVFKININDIRNGNANNNLSRGELALLKLYYNDQWYNDDVIKCFKCKVSLYWFLVYTVGLLARLVIPTAISVLWDYYVPDHVEIIQLETYLNGPFWFLNIILGLTLNGIFNNTRHITQHRCYCGKKCCGQSMLDEYLCWRVIQYHHSQSRFNMFMAFYFNPIEAVHLSTEVLLVTWIFGFQPPTIFFTYVFESIQLMMSHANFRTPWLLGFITIRPEQHALHHSEPWPRSNKWKRKNYSNCPVVEMIFGTFSNPRVDPRESKDFIVGFPEQNHEIVDILFMKKNMIMERIKLTKDGKIYVPMDQVLDNHTMRQN